MNKAIVLMAVLLALGLLVTGCSNKVANEDISVGTGDVVSSNPDTYVDEQIVDETQEVEIGEMI